MASLYSIIETLAASAVDRIERDSFQRAPDAIARIHAAAVREAQEGLENHNRSSQAAQQVHNRINALMVERGLATWQGTALVPAKAGA